MAKADLVPLEGEVIKVSRGGLFHVMCDNGHELIAKLSGRARRHRIRVVLGDRVTVGVSPYDPNRGMITYRHRK